MKCHNAYELRQFLNTFDKKELEGASIWVSYSEVVESKVVVVDVSRSKNKDRYGRLEELQLIGSADDI